MKRGQNLGSYPLINTIYIDDMTLRPDLAGYLHEMTSNDIISTQLSKWHKVKWHPHVAKYLHDVTSTFIQLLTWHVTWRDLKWPIFRHLWMRRVGQDLVLSNLQKDGPCTKQLNRIWINLKWPPLLYNTTVECYQAFLRLCIQRCRDFPHSHSQIHQLSIDRFLSVGKTRSYQAQ